jgi:hypothetical protein
MLEELGREQSRTLRFFVERNVAYDAEDNEQTYETVDRVSAWV